MNKLAFATLLAMGVTTAAIAQQQPGQQSSPRAAQPSTQQPRETPTTRDVGPRGGDRTEQVSFERADDNSDGRISRDEANEIEGFDFSRADTNNDLALSRQEYQAAMATSTPREGPAARGTDAGDRDRGADRRTAQMTFETADKDKDGKVSRDEAREVDGLNFSRADANDDASLSRQEFQTAMAGAQPRG